MLKALKYCQFLLVFLWVFGVFFGQNPPPRVEITPDEIQPDGKLEMHLYVVGTAYTVGEFPEIKGFKKENRIIKHSQVRINRKKKKTNIRYLSFTPPEVSG